VVKFFSVIFYILSLVLSLSDVSAQSLVFNEVMPSNIETLMDEDGEYPDWIEIYNRSDTAISLNGFALSDDANNPLKWIFPPVILDGRSQFMVFASGKNKRLWASHNETVITQGDVWSYFPGTEEPPADWRTVWFNDGGWQTGKSGFGFADGDDSTIVQDVVSIYIRKKFSLDDLNNVLYLLLHVDYDDGFVAYLNNQEIARANVGVPDSIPAFDETAILNHEAQIYQGLSPDLFVINNFRDLLVQGDNVLAVQGHNADINSSDFSLIPFLTLGMNYPPANARGVPELLECCLVPLHTNFKIRSRGERVYLADSSGDVIDDVRFSDSPPDISFGRYPDGRDAWYYFSDPTPRGDNSPLGKLGISGQPELFPAAGLYSTPITVSLTPPDPNSVMYYTLDGSPPTSESTVYTEPIAIEGSTVIRAITIEPHSVPSVINTSSYIFYSSDLPIISLSTAPANLWDEETGIYVLGTDYEEDPPHRGANYWQDWERPIHIEFFEPDGWFGFGIDAGVKIFGGWTRYFPQKSLALFARSRYGSSEGINYQIFPDLDIDTFESIVLRNSGSDWTHTMFRDAMMTGLVKDTDVDVQAYRPSVVFLNGEYWGIHNIREKLNEHYVASHHGVPTDSVDMYNVWGGVLHGNWNAYDQLFTYLNNNNLDNPYNYNYVASLVDVENYLNFNATNIYVDNTDWPGNNYKFYKPRTVGGKWRWFLFDTDFGFSLHDTAAYRHNTLEMATDPDGTGWPNPPYSTFLLRKMLENDQFRTELANRIADFANFNFDTTRIDQHIDRILAVIDSEIPHHLERWDRDYDDWLDDIEELRVFARQRPPYVRQHVVDFFNLGGSSTVSIDVYPPGAAQIQVNTLIPTEYPWEGVYFHRNPVKLTALTNPGYVFSYYGGDVNSTQPSTDIYPIQDVQIVAVFEDLPDIGKPIVINEINYNSDGDWDTKDWVELYAQFGNHDLSGFILRDANDDNAFIFPQGTYLSQGEYLIVVTDSSSFRTYLPDLPNVMGDLDFNFSNNGDLIRLYDSRGARYDSISFNDNASWPRGTDGAGRTLELIDPLMTGDSIAHWRSSPLAHGSPGRDHNYHAPTAFNLARPLDETTTEGESVMLQWFSSVDPDSGDSVIYRVDWSTDPDFNLKLQHFTTDSSIVISEISVDSTNLSGLVSGVTVYWRVTAIDTMGVEKRSQAGNSGWSFRNELPVSFAIGSPYPNPFNKTFTVSVSLPESGDVRVRLYNILGQQIYHLEQTYSAGSHRLLLPTNDLPYDLAAGLYILQIKHEDKISEQKVVLLK